MLMRFEFQRVYILQYCFQRAEPLGSYVVAAGQSEFDPRPRRLSHYDSDEEGYGDLTAPTRFSTSFFSVFQVLATD